jgi:hypothetical protein
MTRAVARRSAGVPAGAASLLGGIVVVVAGLAASLAVARMGPIAAVLPFAGLVAAFALTSPKRTFWAALVCAVVIDTAPVGSTARLTLAAWELPQAVLAQMPLKMNPFEIVIGLCFAGTFMRKAPALPRLPWLTMAVPLVLAAGLAYGVSHGGAVNLAYHEARGLLFGTMAFVVVRRTGGIEAGTLARVALAATALLALAVVYRFVIDLRLGTSGPPMEVWFGHETALFLAAGSLLALALACRARLDHERLLLAGASALMLGATLMTGRRSGVLVLGAGVLVLAFLAFPRKPALLTALAAVSIVLGALYLNAFWDSSVGPVAEPARAVRSQIDPGARDQSSDQYRDIERGNIQRTLAGSPVLGVGFGRPFTEFEELPELAFWSLQLYTPHDNLLWLWLKTGLVGVVLFAGTWLIAWKRCLAAVRGTRTLRLEPLLFAALLVMYLAYARVDLAFITARAAVPLAVALAVILSREWQRAEPEK